MSPKVKFTTELTVPATVDLDLDTAGGRIDVTGLLDGDLRAETSGGSITSRAPAPTAAVEPARKRYR